MAVAGAIAAVIGAPTALAVTENLGQAPSPRKAHPVPSPRERGTQKLSTFDHSAPGSSIMHQSAF